MELDRKDLTIIILTLLLGASLSINLILQIKPGSHYSPNDVVVIGYGSNPAALDPVDSWDDASRVIQHQVVESLVGYDLSTHPNYKLKPVLCEYWIWESKTRISFKLRDNVYFHDQTRMTAKDVKWNFERVMYFCNATGTLPENKSSWGAFPSDLFFLANGTYIFKSFEANDTIDSLNFTINLNTPFSALLDLLTFGATSILSPDSTPFYRFLNLRDDYLIGTGPYEYIHFKRDIEVRLERWDMYWAFPGYFERVIFRIIEDDEARMTAGLAGQFDYIGGVSKTYSDTFDADPDFIVKNVGEDFRYFYLEIYCGPPFNSSRGNFEHTMLNGKVNQWINSTWRRAIALAINYTFIWEKIRPDSFPGTPLISKSMLGYNKSLEGKMAYDFPFDGTYEGNIKKAREYIQQMGFGYDGPGKTNPWDTTYPGLDESKWLSSSFRTLDLTWNYADGDMWVCYDSIYPPKLSDSFKNSIQLIGIHFAWGCYLGVNDYPWRGPPQLTPWIGDVDIISSEWAHDFLDPLPMMENLLYNGSEICFSHISDPLLYNTLKSLKSIINIAQRNQTYQWLQSYLFDITREENPSSYCHIPLYSYETYQVHKAGLKGIKYNSLHIIECWNWYYK